MATTLKLRTDIKKLKGALSSKSLPAPIKAKLKAQLDKAQNELKAMQSGAKPRKVSTTKGTQTALTSLQKLVSKKKFSVYQGKGIDLKKDADQGALAVGRRVSKGIKGNQFGDAKSSKGNVYYEYRANRLDVKQPKKAQKYPKLKNGGYMAKGGEVRFVDEFTTEDGIEVSTDITEGGKKFYSAIITKYPLQRIIPMNEDKNAVVEKAKKIELEMIEYLSKNEHRSDKLNQRFYAKGGSTQGYDDKEDERLGMEYGKMSSKDLNSTHARRDDARFEERMARGGEIDVEDIKNKIYGYFKHWLGNYQTLLSDEQLVNSIKRKLGTKYFRFFKGDPMVNDWRSIENSLKSRNNRDFLKENMEISLEEKSLEIYNSKNEKLEKGGYMAQGGVTEKEVVESNAEMVLSKIKEVHHHADELGDIVTNKSDIEAWVVAKIERASTDLSDITHYLDGQHEKMSMGGSINNYVHKMDKK